MHCSSTCAFRSSLTMKPYGAYEGTHSTCHPWPAKKLILGLADHRVAMPPRCAAPCEVEIVSAIKFKALGLGPDALRPRHLFFL